MASSVKDRRSAGRAGQTSAAEDGDGAREAIPIDWRARTAARTTLAVVLVVLALWIAADFLPAVLWAVIFAITTWPLYTRFEALLGSRGNAIVAPLTFTLVLGLILLLPVALATYQLSQQVDLMSEWITRARESGVEVPSWVASLPIAAETVTQWWRDNLSDPKTAATWFQNFNTESGTEFAKSLGGQFFHRSFMFFFSLMTLFVLLRNGSWIAARTLDTSDRILGDPGERLATKMVDAVRGTVNGTVFVAVVEGLLIGLVYGLVGVPNAILFTILTIAFAMLPFGAWAAFSVAAVTLLVTGQPPWTAFVVFGWGATVMFVGDHFVWPTLVGGAARLPFLFALVGIFGGLATFGLIGLFVGPVIMAALMTVWREWIVKAPRRSSED